MKKCSKCMKILELSYFNKDKSKSDGLYPSCRKCQNKKERVYYHKNKVQINSEKRDKYCPKKKNKYYEANKVTIKARTKAYKRNRYNTDLEFKIQDLLTNGLRRLLKGKDKNNRALHYLGCSIDEFKIYIESQFQPGMTWDNWSRDGWHLDHINPISSFNLLNEEEIQIACHYTNLQPLWGKENQRKGAKLPNIKSS